MSHPPPPKKGSANQLAHGSSSAASFRVKPPNVFGTNWLGLLSDRYSLTFPPHKWTQEGTLEAKFLGASFGRPRAVRICFLESMSGARASFLICLVTKNSTGLFNHLPEPSIFQKGHLCSGGHVLIFILRLRSLQSRFPESTKLVGGA